MPTYASVDAAMRNELVWRGAKIESEAWSMWGKTSSRAAFVFRVLGRKGWPAMERSMPVGVGYLYSAEGRVRPTSFLALMVGPGHPLFFSRRDIGGRTTAKRSAVEIAERIDYLSAIESLREADKKFLSWSSVETGTASAAVASVLDEIIWARDLPRLVRDLLRKGFDDSVSISGFVRAAIEVALDNEKNVGSPSWLKKSLLLNNLAEKLSLSRPRRSGG